MSACNCVRENENVCVTSATIRIVTGMKHSMGMLFLYGWDPSMKKESCELDMIVSLK